MCSILANIPFADEKGKARAGFYTPEYVRPQFILPTIRAAEYCDIDCQHEKNSDDLSDVGLSNTAEKVDVYSDIENGEIGVMTPDCQDPLLAKTYLNLPVLP